VTGRPRKRFGQHFLVDTDVISRIVDAVSPQPDDILVEIGPGRAALTDALLPCGATLHAIELDRDLAAALHDKYSSVPRVRIHAGDALKFDFSTLGDHLRLVGNLPYNVSTPLVFHILDFRERVVDAHFMLQKEVVDRMAAAPGSRTYGRLSVMLQSRMAVQPLFDVAPGAFSPPPRVWSSVVRLEPLAAGARADFDDVVLGEVVKAAFSKRRKTLRNALQQAVSLGDLEAAGLDPAVRPEQVGVTQWIALARRIAPTS